MAKEKPTTLQKLANFCYYWDLQAGVIICSWLIIAVYGLSASLNAILENSEDDPILRKRQYMVVYFFLITSMLAALTVFFAGTMKSKPIMFISLIVLVAMLVFYIILYLMSFSINQWRKICINGRCPETIWYSKAGWRISTKACPPNAKNFPLGLSATYYSNTVNISLFQDLKPVAETNTLSTLATVDSGKTKRKIKTSKPARAMTKSKYSRTNSNSALKLFGYILGAIWMVLLLYHIFLGTLRFAELFYQETKEIP